MDYRCTNIIAPVSNLKLGKQYILSNKSIIGKYTNHYRLLHSKHDARNSFDTLYNKRCAYCGVSVDVLDYQLFEIDHFDPTEPKNNSLFNLILSCHKCNRLKKDFFYPELSILCHPDLEYMPEVFYRQEDFTIIVSDLYKENSLVELFYKKLELGSNLRRLDFLLTTISDVLISRELSYNKRYILMETRDKIREARNKVYKV